MTRAVLQGLITLRTVPKSSQTRCVTTMRHALDNIDEPGHITHEVVQVLCTAHEVQMNLSRIIRIAE